MQHSIATVITYCTNDFRFISKCIEEAKLFSQEVLVVVCDHFFNGKEENRLLLEHTYAAHPDCQFIEFAYLKDRIYSKYHKMGPKDADWAAYWAATSRNVGLQYVDPGVERVLFLDSDEIAEGRRFHEWFKERGASLPEVLRFGSYYYAIDARFQSKLYVNLPFFVKKERFDALTLLNGLERIGAYQMYSGTKVEYVLGLDDKPLFHHYSWVRTKEECLEKSRSWGHHHEQDWSTLIEEVFQHQNPDRLFGSEHRFRVIEEPYFDPLQVPIPQEKPTTHSSNVLKVTDRDVFKKEIEHALL